MRLVFLTVAGMLTAGIASHHHRPARARNAVHAAPQLASSSAAAVNDFTPVLASPPQQSGCNALTTTPVLIPSWSDGGFVSTGNWVPAPAVLNTSLSVANFNTGAQVICCPTLGDGGPPALCPPTVFTVAAAVLDANSMAQQGTGQQTINTNPLGSHVACQSSSNGPDGGATVIADGGGSFCWWVQ